MNPQMIKNEWDALAKAPLTAPNGKTEQKHTDERYLSGRHTQPLPYLNDNDQMVQYSDIAVAEHKVLSSTVNRKVKAALASGPNPAASLADIHRLLAGPTRNLHDAMFEEVVTILEESDREVQRSLTSLEKKCSSLFHITEGLVFSSNESKEQCRKQAEHFQAELQKSATAQRETLSELFLIIDGKLEELAAEMTREIDVISEKVDAALREASAKQKDKMRELEKMFLAASKAEAGRLASRLEALERKSSSEKEHLSAAFAGGLSSIADRLKAMKDR